MLIEYHTSAKREKIITFNYATITVNMAIGSKYFWIFPVGFIHMHGMHVNDDVTILK